MTEIRQTVLRDDEIWNLNTSLAPLLADALRRLAEAGNSCPMDEREGVWEERLHAAARDFEGVEATEGEHVPYDGLEFLRERWLDLWD